MHIQGRRAQGAAHRGAVKVWSCDGLRAVLVVEKEGHRRSGAKPIGQLAGLPQRHEARGPAVVNQKSLPELGHLADEFAVIGRHIDMLVVVEFGIDPQVSAISDGVRKRL